MSEIDPREDAPLVDWSDLGVSGLLPMGTVTLLLADVERSTRLWETQPDETTAAIAHLREVLGGEAYESLARKGEPMTAAAMVTYEYDQIDQARTELERSRFT